jgi:regulator of nucleoside diphosphate kinase
MMPEDPMFPAITLGVEEHRRLVILAMTGSSHTARESDYLHYELARANVVPDGDVPDDTARIGSTVTYCCEDALRRSAKLVVPADADVGAGKLSILSMVGAALLGLRPGQAITLMGWDGGFRKLSVLSVTGPVSAPPIHQRPRTVPLMRPR